MRSFVVALIALLALPAAAAESSCLEAVDQLGRQLGLATTLPSSDDQRPGGNLTDTLRGSGGVLQPPDQGAAVAVTPPEAADRMPTTPALEPHTASPAARQAQLESLLTAARAAGQRGDTAQCVARLAEAQQLAERLPDRAQ